MVLPDIAFTILLGFIWILVKTVAFDRGEFCFEKGPLNLH